MNLFKKKFFLNYEIFDSYLEVFILDSDKCIKHEIWSSLNNVFCKLGRDENFKKISTSIYISLLDDNLAEIVDEYRLKITFKKIAELTSYKILLMGLPNFIPHSLNIKCYDSPDSSNFKLVFQFIDQIGRELPCFKINGIFVEISNDIFLLKEPFYSIIQKINIFNETFFNSIEEKMLEWAKIKGLFSSDILSDKFLREFNVYVPDSFTLNDDIDNCGEFTFNPVLYNKKNDIYGFEQEDIQTLPNIYQKNFEKYFYTRDIANAYSLGQGNYTVLSNDLKNIFNIIKKYKKKPLNDRKKFFSNPRTYLRQELEDIIEEEKLDDFFIETQEFADRVRDIGIWQAPIIPFLKQAKTPWLPPEEIGIIVNGKKIEIKPNNLDNLIEEANSKINSSENSLLIDNESVSVTSDLIDKLESLKNNYDKNIQLINNEKSSDHSDDSIVPDNDVIDTNENNNRIALLILRNIKDVELVANKRRIIDNSIGDIDAWFRTFLKSEPMSHQKKGFNWLLQSYFMGFSGSLLADDMGLGKTFQSLAFLMFIKDMMKNNVIKEKPFLIVAPTGLIKNWEDEHNFHLNNHGLGEITRAYSRFIADLKIRKIDKTKELSKGVSILNKSKLKRSDLVITTYETMRDYQHSFGKIKWGVIIFDEIQKMKNPKALVTDAGKAMNTDFVLALTGTPVENHISDLWCIVDRVRPGHLGSLKGFLKEYSVRDIEKIKHLKLLLTHSDNKLPPLMIRRMKDSSLKGLPKIFFKTLKEVMPKYQAKQYSSAVFEAKNSNKRGSMLKALQKFRSISLIPDLQIENDFNKLIDKSARLKVTFKILDEIFKKNEKALIFIESKDVQSYLVEMIKSRYKLKNQPMIINGEIPGLQRKNRVDIFQNRSGFDVMLLSPKAGGVGLTLTAANNVIHLSRWWNPAVEDQCTDRVYRIGQRKPVYVYYPLAVHPDFKEMSFDIKLSELLERKRSLSKAILAPVSITDNDLKSLFVSATQGVE